MVKWKGMYVKIKLTGKPKAIFKGLDPYWIVLVKHA